MSYEIEVKIPINNKEHLLNELVTKNFIINKSTEQLDKVFRKVETDSFENTNELLFRIRLESGVYSLTFKRVINFTDVIEFESSIGNPNAMENIILNNGFREYAYIKKKRLKGKINDINVCIDEVDELGDFLEVELIINDYESHEKAKMVLYHFLASLGFDLGKICEKRYHTMIHELQCGRE